MDVKFNEYYATDECDKVKEFYGECFEFYKNQEEFFGGESIFSINTILNLTCNVLDREKYLDKILYIDRESPKKKIVLDKKTLERFPLNKIEHINKELGNHLFGKLSSERFLRIYLIMESVEFCDDFKKMLITYIYTIRTLGNYMPLLKLRMDGSYKGRTQTINQRKGNFKKYMDDPLYFYDELSKYISNEKNAKFEEELKIKYKIKDGSTMKGFLERNYLNVINEYFADNNSEKSDYYLKDLLKSGIDGIYIYMYNACMIINKRTSLLQTVK